MKPKHWVLFSYSAIKHIVCFYPPPWKCCRGQRQYFNEKRFKGKASPYRNWLNMAVANESGNMSYESRFRQSGSRVANPCPGEVMGTVTSYWVLSAEKWALFHKCFRRRKALSFYCETIRDRKRRIHNERRWDYSWKKSHATQRKIR